MSVTIFQLFIFFSFDVITGCGEIRLHEHDCERIRSCATHERYIHTEHACML